MKVRELLPIRRAKLTKNPKKDWTKHKPDLKLDFHNHCGYCGSYDGFRHTFFEVDHFIPKDFLLKTRSSMGRCFYPNLVYGCKFCNNNKSSLWPSKSEKFHSTNNEGFVDPCSPDYDIHLARTKNGGIKGKTPLGKWMETKAFKFDQRDFSIKLLWEINESRKLLDLITSKLDNWPIGSEERNGLMDKAEKLSFKYYLLHKELINYYNLL